MILWKFICGACHEHIWNVEQVADNIRNQAVLAKYFHEANPKFPPPKPYAEMKCPNCNAQWAIMFEINDEKKEIIVNAGIKPNPL